jgi:hypothetical protein
MLTIFSYAASFEISQYLLEATPAIMEGYPILDEASRRREERNMQQRKRRAEMSIEQRDEINRNNVSTDS